MIDVVQIRKLVADIEAHQTALKSLTDQHARLMCTHGQETVNITMNGVSFNITGISRESCYMPMVLGSMEVLHAEAVRLVDYHIKITRSKLEGAEYKLRVATRGSAE